MPLGRTHAQASGAAPNPVEDVVSERTRELIRKRRFGKTHRRGWVMKRALAVADLAGLTLAFLLARTLTDAPVQTRYDSVVPAVEFFTFFLSLPLWLVLARTYGLYDNDETAPITRRSTTCSASSTCSPSAPGGSSR